MADRYLSAYEAAAVLGVSVSTMYRYIDKGVPVVRGPNGRIRIKESDVQALMPFLHRGPRESEGLD